MIRRRTLIVISVVVAVIVVLFGVCRTSAQAAAPVPTGHVDKLTALPGGRLSIRGWAADPRVPGGSIIVTVWIDGRRIATTRAIRQRPDVNRALKITGRHGFTMTVPRPKAANQVQVWGSSVIPPYRAGLLTGTVYLIKKPTTSAGARIVTEARRYLGVPYVYGGATPSTGFDCSGYTRWVYEHARVAALAHNSEVQRHEMRIIARASARPGDLIFYMAGGVSYHVAIYAGGNNQYAAPAPGQRVKMEAIWSRAVQFGTNWH